MTKKLILETIQQLEKTYPEYAATIAAVLSNVDESKFTAILSYLLAYLQCLSARAQAHLSISATNLRDLCEHGGVGLGLVEHLDLHHLSNAALRQVLKETQKHVTKAINTNPELFVNYQLARLNGTSGLHDFCTQFFRDYSNYLPDLADISPKTLTKSRDVKKSRGCTISQPRRQAVMPQKPTTKPEQLSLPF